MLPVDSEEDLIAHFVKTTATIRQQDGIFESHIILCCIIVGHILRLVAVCLNICSKLIQNTTFLQNTSVALLDFQP